MIEKLNSILRMENKEARHKALIEYAKSLKVNTLKARDTKGETSEDELTVLIYDALKNQKTMQLQSAGIIVGALIILGIFIAVLLLFTKFMSPSL